MSARGWALTMLTLIYTSNFIDRTILGILQQPIKTELHLSDWQLGLLGGATFALFYTALGVPIARAAERYNRVWIIGAAVALWSIMTAMSGLAATYLQLLLFRIGVGVGEAGGTPPAHSIISDHYPPERRASALAIYSLGIPLGSLFGALLGGVIAETWGWRLAFVIVGAPGLLLALLLIVTVKEPARGGSDSSGTVSSDSVSRPDPPRLGAVIKTLWTARAFRHIAAGCVLGTMGTYALLAFTAAWFIREFGVSLTQAGFATGVIGGASAGLGTLLGGFVSERGARKDRRWLVWGPAAGLIIAGPLYAVGFLSTHWLIAAGLLVVPAALQYMFIGPTYGVMHNLVEPRMRATASALLLLAVNLLGLGLGPPLLGLASDAFADLAFGGGFQATCVQAEPAGSASTLCAASSAAGLRYALLAVAPLFVWAGLHYWAAARTLCADLDRRIPTLP